VRALQGKFGRGDCPKITRAFAFALLNPQPGVPINWSNPAIGHRGTVLAYQAYQGRNGVLCRPFRQIMVAEGRTHAGNGAACLIGGRWTIVR
jgi:surface antigen